MENNIPFTKKTKICTVIKRTMRMQCKITMYINKQQIRMGLLHESEDH